MNGSANQTNAWIKLTLPIAILLAIATTGELFIKGLLRDNPYLAAQALGQDMISLAVVLPTLIITGALAGRGSPLARLIWLGVLIYLVYTYVIAAFDQNFNPLFLVYVALLGCSLYALIGGMLTTNFSGIRDRFSGRTPVRAISVYLAVLAFLFYFLWLREIIPALVANEVPQSIQVNGTPTNAVHVLDMAWILPAFGIAAFNLWRRQAIGYTLASALLTYSSLLVLAILSMAVTMVMRGHPVAAPQLVIFGTLFVLNLGMLSWFLSGARSQPALE